MATTCRVTYFANAGFALELHDKLIYIDALVDYRVLGFSALNKTQIREVLSSARRAPDYLLFTHCHPDHYSRRLVGKAVKQWPDTVLISPQEDFLGQKVVTGDNWQYSDGPLTFSFFRLPHEKNNYPTIAHYGIRISDGTNNIFVTGDSEIATPEIAYEITTQKPSLVFLNFPWITLRKGRQFIQEQLNNIPIVILHIPFPEDDVDHFRKAVAYGLDKMGHPATLTTMETFLQEINISFK